MRFQTLGNKPAFITNTVKNGESSSQIRAGNLVILKLGGTDDGLAVVLPATAGAAKSNIYQYGVAIETANPGANFQIQQFGYCRNVTLVRASRAASTDSWASGASMETNHYLIPNTLGNGVSSGGTTSGAGVVPLLLAESLASYASSASNASDTRTLITQSVKAIIRML